MLDYLHLKNVGPAPEMCFDFAERLNLITGDNGLGKSFVLDVAWWALTRTWSGTIALPTGEDDATINYIVRGKKGRPLQLASTFRREDESWPVEAKRPPMPGIVVYVRIDGGFSVWDPARNYWRTDKDRPPAYHFESHDVWNGLDIGGRRVSEGLERDWVNWQEGGKEQFKVLQEVLRVLSPPTEPLQAGKPRRLFLGEGRDRPTLLMAGQEVPVSLASAGIRRALALAYFLVWAWHEHRFAAQLLKAQPEDRIVVLFDEPETHLHPRWQRNLVPSLLVALETLRGLDAAKPQILVATHAPLVLASLEPLFDEESDELFHLELSNGKAVVQSGIWAKQGDVTSWLVSPIFGLDQARSIEAERAIEAAEAFMRGDRDALPKGLKTQVAIHRELVRVLPGDDPFWPRWLVTGKALDLTHGRTKGRR